MALRRLGRLPGFRRVVVFGVGHSTRELPKYIFDIGKPTRNLARLNIELKGLRRRGGRRVGVEFLPSSKYYQRGVVDRENPAARYFIGAKILIERAGMVAVELEDLGIIKELEEEIHAFPQNSNPEIRRILMERYGDSDSYEQFELLRAVNPWRSIQMTRKARKLKLDAIIVGLSHANDLRRKGYRIKQVDPPNARDAATLKELHEESRQHDRYFPLLDRLFKEIQRPR